MSRFCSSLFACVLMIGCATESTTTDRSLVEVPEDCAKIEGSDIGQNVTIQVNGVSVTFSNWIAKDGEPNEFIGFTLSSDAVFTVKAGQDIFTGFGSSFVNPNGTGGPLVKGISYVMICTPDKEPPPCDKDKEKCD